MFSKIVKNKNMKTIKIILVLWITTWSQEAFGRKIIFPEGLYEDDIIEWSGNLPSIRMRSWIDLRGLSDEMRKFRIEIHPYKHRILVAKLPSVFTRRESICAIGADLIAPEKEFNIKIRVKVTRYMIYVNNELKYTLNDVLDPKLLRSLKSGGPATLTLLKKLDVGDYSRRLNSNYCGRTRKLPVNENIFSNVCNYQENVLQSRIVSGTLSRPGTVPWQASVRIKPQYTNGSPHKCGAALISQCWAISAGHCFPVVKRRALKRFVVRVGDYFNDDTLSKPNKQFASYESVQDLEISQVYKHENYASNPTWRNDIALIKLKTCAKIGNLVKPVCLPSSADQFEPGDSCTVSGWGASNWTQTSSEYPKCLMYGQVKILSPEICEQQHFDKEYNNQIMMCAMGDGGIDTCQGDSGGPFVCRRGDGNKHFLFGVTSWGVKCGKVQYAGVYTRVASFMSWLYLKTSLHPSDEEVSKRVKKNKLSDQLCQNMIYE